jgi:hypothetical protein
VLFPRKTEAMLVVPDHWLIVVRAPIVAHKSIGPTLGVIYDPNKEKYVTIQPRIEVIETITFSLNEMPDGQFIPVLEGEESPPIHPRNVFVKEGTEIRRMCPDSGESLVDINSPEASDFSALYLGNLFQPGEEWPMSFNEEALRQLPEFPG